jgi:DNA-binding CsgD family transcriptional regulator
VQGLVFGDLSVAIDCGRRLRTDRTANMRLWALTLLGIGGLLNKERQAITEALDLARRDAARGVPIARDTVGLFEGILGMIDGREAAQSTPVPRFDKVLDLVAGRDAINRGDVEQARAIADSLAGRGPTLEASRHVTLGLLDHDEDAWHRALRGAAEYGFRLIAVDALEGLGVAAASADSPTESLRLFGAADRLRAQTGYRWRFPIERRRYDTALSTARDALAGRADDAWSEGHSLDLDAAAEYASRARGERTRPRHGWDSLTPTERRVVELAAAGHTNPKIAQLLLMSRSTVKTHLEHIYSKIGIHNRTELAAEATRHDRTDR